MEPSNKRNGVGINVIKEERSDRRGEPGEREGGGGRVAVGRLGPTFYKLTENPSTTL